MVFKIFNERISCIKFSTGYEFLIGRLFANRNSSSKAPNGVLGKTSNKEEHWGEYEQVKDGSGAYSD